MVNQFEMSENHMQIPTAMMLSALVIVILIIVVRGAKKTSNVSDYAIGSFQFSPIAVGLALAASMTSAATFIINPGLIALYGYAGIVSYAIVLPLAAFISLVFLTRRFRDHGTRVKALTMAQWMGNRYKNKNLSLFFALLSVFLISFIVLIVVGLAQLLAKPLGVDPVMVMVFLVIFVFGYMMFGGANAMVYTNTVQALLMLLVAIILLWSGHEFFTSGPQGLTAHLNAIDPRLTQPTNPESLLFRDYFEIIFCQIIIGVAVVCQPHILTKSLILTKSSDISRYLTTGIIVMTVFFAVVIVGLYARISFPDFKVDGLPIKPDQIIAYYITDQFSTALVLIVTMGLIAAGISTLEGLIQSLSVTFTQDFLLDHVSHFKNWNEKKKIGLNRVIIAILALVSIFFSYRQIVAPDLSVAIFAQNGVYAFFGAAFFPLISGMFSKHNSYRLIFLTACLSLIIHFSTYYGHIGKYMQNEINNPAISATYAITISTLVGLVGLLVIHFQNKGISPKALKT
jgi:sodium/pantothenate symporter